MFAVDRAANFGEELGCSQSQDHASAIPLRLLATSRFGGREIGASWESGAAAPNRQ
jgi:hypothetical protein